MAAENTMFLQESMDDMSQALLVAHNSSNILIFTSFKVCTHNRIPSRVTCRRTLGESAHRITERIKDHNGTDDTSHVLEHSTEKSQKNANTVDFKIIDKNFHNNKQKQKITEAL